MNNNNNNNNNNKTKRTAVHTGLWLSIVLGWLVASAVGCIEGRSSTHELEHVVPTHWPTSLGDAANKIEDRMSLIGAPLTEHQAARTELIEIISWLPEVAADTALRETDWNSINAACRSIESLMKSADDSPQALQELRTLCGRLRELHAQFSPGNTG